MSTKVTTNYKSNAGTDAPHDHYERQRIMRCDKPI